MANIKGIKGNPLGAIKHDLRERATYKNEDIDPERSGKNYLIESHGKDSGQVYSYYRSLVDGVYHREKSTITTFEVVATAPKDLPKEQEADFFKSTTEFLDDYFFQGDKKRVLLATTHYDEAGNHPHEHYIAVLPSIKNEKYVSVEDKMASGIEKIEKDLGICPTEEQKSLMMKTILTYEQNGDINEGIHSFADCLGLERDSARKAFLRCKRKDKQLFKERLMAKDEFITQEKMALFHSAYQKWIDTNGPKCSVYQGGRTISIAVEQLKEMTAVTGVKLEKGITPKELGELIKLRERTREMREWGREHEWER